VSTDQYGTAPAQPEYQGGVPPVPPQQYGYAQPPVFVQTAPTNGLGVAGFVTGLLGLVLCWVPWLGILLAGVGIVLSGIGISTGKKKGMSIGLAIAGLVCGIIALIPAVIVLVALFSVASELSNFAP
jgi:hypothetical protein